jgi:hypothetical protein
VQVDKEDWLSSRDLVEHLGSRRDNDVRVVINGILVPIAGIRYESLRDMYVIALDQFCEDYKIAMAPDETQPVVRRPLGPDAEPQ